MTPSVLATGRQDGLDDRGPGLWRRIYSDGSAVLTNVRIEGEGRKAGSGLINTATSLLFMLAIGLFGVSLNAQYRYVYAVKHVHLAALVEALALDAAMAIFSLLALGLARAGKSAVVERALIQACAAGSAAMNYAASDVASPRSVAAYVVPPVLLSIVVDRVIAVIRKHVLGEDERSPWALLGRGVLYGLRFVLAPATTAKGIRRAVLNAAPVPEVEAVAEAPKAIDPPKEPRPEKPKSERPKSEAPVNPRPQSKTAQFLRYVADEHGSGDLASIKLDAVYRLAKDCAPKFDLHAGSARTALRNAILQAKGDQS